MSRENDICGDCTMPPNVNYLAQVINRMIANPKYTVSAIAQQDVRHK